MRAERNRRLADRVLAPDTGREARNVLVAHVWLRVIRAVTGTQGEDRSGSSLTRENAASLVLWPCTDARQILGKQVVETGRLGWEHRDQRVVRGLRDGRVHRCVGIGPRNAGVTAIATTDRVDGVEDGDVHDRNRTGRAAWPELLAEHAVFSWSDGRVIEAAGIDRDPVPVAKAVRRVRTLELRGLRRLAAELGRELVVGSKELLDTARGLGRSCGYVRRDGEQCQQRHCTQALTVCVH